MDFDISTLFAGLVFGTFGWGAFRYGRKQQKARPLAIGIILMILPWLVTSGPLLWLSGAALTGLIFWPK